MLSDTGAACVGHFFNPVFKKRKRITAGPKSGTNEQRNTHIKILWGT
jgi:hypothetical protein